MRRKRMDKETTNWGGPDFIKVTETQFRNFAKDFKDKIEVLSNTDLVIKSEGFINIKKKSTIWFSNLDHKIIETRPSIFGGTHE